MDPTASDEALLKAYLAGDRGSLGELARRYEGPLLGLAAALLDGRKDLACDAVQETWVRVIRFGAKFDGRSGFKTWVYRIAINQCRAVKAGTARGKGSDIGAEFGAEFGAGAPVELDEDRERLREAVRSLPADRRMLVLLCHHHGMTNQTAAEILGLPVGTLKTRLRAAMTDLRARLLTGVEP